ncbi:nitroreductase [Caulobacter mirabilis]|uniref:Putative NAD(P)H nitroreductase n=1 Tax=Caulobacter mirabilis TaxID=69666 RepID=A0A2D2AVQ7_9CAUL|nr:nitroreductase [Caulobacter mirabilis]
MHHHHLGRVLDPRHPRAPAFGDALPLDPSPETLAFLARRRSAPALTLAAPAPSPEELEDLLTLAARVPDHGKLAPWRFIILEGAGKARFVQQLEALAAGRADAAKLTAKLGKLKAPPLAVAVVSRTVTGEIPAWEQLMSAGAVCTTLTYAALAMGYGANWITDWYAYDEEAKTVLGLGDYEQVAGYVFLGTATEAPQERQRPDVKALTTRF